jgi:hypothetical protein
LTFQDHLGNNPQDPISKVTRAKWTGVWLKWYFHCFASVKSLVQTPVPQKFIWPIQHTSKWQIKKAEIITEKTNSKALSTNHIQLFS